MSFTCWNAPNVKYNTLEKQKLNSTLDLITTEKMYGNQMLYLQAAIFQVKTITSTDMQNSYWLSRYAASISTRKKNKEKPKQRENFLILTLEILAAKGLNQELNCMHHFVHLLSLSKCLPIFLNYYVINNGHITNQIIWRQIW